MSVYIKYIKFTVHILPKTSYKIKYGLQTILLFCRSNPTSHPFGRGGGGSVCPPAPRVPLPHPGGGGRDNRPFQKKGGGGTKKGKGKKGKKERGGGQSLRLK